MNFSRKAVLVSILSLFLMSIAFGASAKATATHGKTVKGAVVSVDETGKTFSLKASNGKTTELVWNAATKVTGPALKAGETATVRYMVRDKQNVATSIMTAEKHAAAVSTKSTATTKTAAASTTTTKKH
ncbi:MAG: hypothetical protein QOH21_582 [Acidobacteriota bacterium]|nr:hypothetical protein [Acidobacteriota bacterium]